MRLIRTDDHSCAAQAKLSIAMLQRKVGALSHDYDITMEMRLSRGGYCSGQRRLKTVRQLRLAIKRQFLSHYFGEPPEWRIALRGWFGRRTLPDFCVIGPMKAGTSDIAMNLLLHPSVMTPLSKEIWPAEYPRLPAYYPTMREKRRWKEKHGIALSPYLMPALHWLDFAPKLAQAAPHMKLVITLRNPVWRMYSHWKWELLLAGRQRVRDLAFMSSFDLYADRSLERFPCTRMFTACGSEGLRSSIYWQAVEYWMNLFGRRNVLVLESDWYFRSKAEFMYAIQDFVGLPRMSPPSLSRCLNENPLKCPPPSEQTLAKLKGFFRPHNERLFRLIGRSFEW